MKLNFSLPSDKQPIPKHAKKVFSGEIFSVYHWEQELFDGSTTTFEKLKREDTIGVIAITEEKSIVITHQEQPGVEPFYSLPGGRIDQGEDVGAAALRELREETGMKPEELIPWFAIQPIEKIEWIIYTAIARGCKKVGKLQLDPGEKIDLMELSFEEFVELTRHPQFRDLEISYWLYKAENENRLGEIKELFFG